MEFQPHLDPIYIADRLLYNVYHSYIYYRYPGAPIYKTLIMLIVLYNKNIFLSFNVAKVYTLGPICMSF